MARNYGLGLDKLVDEDTTQWRQQGNAPGWAAGYSFGKGAVEDYQRGAAERDAAEASTAAQQEQKSGADNTPIDKSFYTRNAAGNYQLTPEQQQAVADSGDAYVPNGGKVLATGYKYGLGANPTSFRDTPYTAAEKRQAGLQAMADSYGQSKAPGSAARAEYYNNRIEAAQDRVEEAKDRDTRRQLTKAQLAAQSGALTLQTQNITEGARRARLSAAGDVAFGELPNIGSWVDGNGKKVSKNAEGAQQVNEARHMQMVSDAYKASGDYGKATEASSMAARYLVRDVQMGIGEARDLKALNKVYKVVDNGKDFEQYTLTDGRIGFRHVGDGPDVEGFVTQKGDPNPFETFKQILSARAGKDPVALSAFVSAQRAETQKFRELDVALDIKRITAETLRATAKSANDLKGLALTAHNNERTDRLAASRASLLARADADYHKKIPPPSAEGLDLSNKVTAGKYEADVRTYQETKDKYLSHVSNTYDTNMRLGREKTPAGAAGTGATAPQTAQGFGAAATAANAAKSGNTATPAVLSAAPRVTRTTPSGAYAGPLISGEAPIVGLSRTVGGIREVLADQGIEADRAALIERANAGLLTPSEEDRAVSYGLLKPRAN